MAKHALNGYTTMDLFKLKPACEGLSRPEVTSKLNRALVEKKLERKNAYCYWAHEVKVPTWFEDKPEMRLDFLSFEPAYMHTCTAASAIELGTFSVYEVKSCPEDFKSGHGLNFIGDKNYLVYPVEHFEAFKGILHNNPEIREACQTADHLMFGERKNGTYGFYLNEFSGSLGIHPIRKRSASELLLCMIRALLANSDLADVEHRIDQMKGVWDE